MGSNIWQIIILVVLAIIIFARLLNEFGKRDGFEAKPKIVDATSKEEDATVVEDDEIIEGDDQFVSAIQQAKAIEPSFSVNSFLLGAKQAYEMILMAYLNGDMESVRPFVDKDVYEGFEQAVQKRQAAGHEVKAEFVGISNVELKEAEYFQESNELELGVQFVSRIKRIVVDADGKIIEGEKDKIETEYDNWYFSRVFGNDNPNWMLVATGE